MSAPHRCKHQAGRPPRLAARDAQALHAPRRRSTAPAHLGLDGWQPWRAKIMPIFSAGKVRPNPSLEARPNGRPPGPGRRYAVHFFASPGLASCRRSRLSSNVRRRMKDNRIIIYPPEPDRLEKAVRAICGALFGPIPVFFVWLWFGPFSSMVTWSMVLASMVVCSLCAVRQGDVFWRRALGAFRWFG